MCQLSGIDRMPGLGTLWDKLYTLKKNMKIPQNLPNVAQVFSHNCHSTHTQYEKEIDSSNCVAMFF